MTPVVIRVAGVPVGKGRPRFVRATGRAYTPQKTRSYEDVIRYTAQVEMGDRPLLEGALDVLVVASFPIPASMSKGKRLAALSGALHPTVKPDADNLLKVLDALNGIVFADDKQVVRADVRKVYSATPELTIRVQAA